MTSKNLYQQIKTWQPSFFRSPSLMRVREKALLTVYDDYTKYPNPTQVKKTVELLGMTTKQVQFWFRDRRARERRQRRYMQRLKLRDTRVQLCSSSVNSDATTSDVSSTPGTPSESAQPSFEFPDMPCMFQSSPYSTPSPSLSPSPSYPIEPSWSADAVDSCWPGHVPCVPHSCHCGVICGLRRYGNGYSAVPQFPTPPQSHRYLP
ncbi:homeobox protein OTX1 A-like [Ptychodera flava]|uniref:homeobox protein OTX1 A-like n=1 Tax=Ptychodera flava TaxID=63121 RepID=UPI00396A4DB2